MTVQYWSELRSMRLRWKVTVCVIFLAAVVYTFCLPEKLFNDPYSTVLNASDGSLLSATLSSDGQWRFPQNDAVSEKFAQALITFEDKRFRSHPGVDPLSMVRAMQQNVQAGKIVSGGSTISMQLIRLSRKGQSRTVLEKGIELVLATRLELRYSKDEILSMYASHAPFGGNVVGLDAACWRYFGVDQSDLSWGEAALLAVLPNAPSLMHPGKNRELLLAKRNRLLDKLQEAGIIDEFTCTLAKDEPIPAQPNPLPRHARHLLLRAVKEGSAQKRVHTTIDKNLQWRAEQIVADHHERLSGNQIFNAAAIVVEVRTGNILAYVGNIPSVKPEVQSEVDVIAAPRSTGSILKPFLYAAMLDEGKMLPRTLLPDVPLMINGFSPKNFTKQYDGAVHADQALIRSLNVPAVEMLQEYRYEKFHSLLRSLGFSTLIQQPDHYGLSLILGGAEGTLFDITGIYASMARTLNNYFEVAGRNRYSKNDFRPLTYVSRPDSVRTLEGTSLFSAASIYLTFEALKELYRPGEQTGWKHFSSSKEIAWKTGTSFGLRDGWAVGVTPEYAVGVWVGNADGEGRPGLTGTEAASPLMFEIFSQLPETTWFDKPLPELHQTVVCRQSGHRAGMYCMEKDTVAVQKAGLETTACPYHKMLHLSKDQRHQLHTNCAPLESMVHAPWFVLPPVQEFYFRSRTLSYKALPSFRADCETGTTTPSMDLIYPKVNAKLFIPRDIEGNPGSAIFELAHHNAAASVYWHLDGEYLGVTKKTHHFPVNPPAGKHRLTIVDDQGQSLERSFEVVGK